MQTLIDAFRDHAWAWLLTAGALLGVALLVLNDVRDGRRARKPKDDGRTRITHNDHARTVHKIDPWQGSGPSS